jgi:hypothetical protein
MSTSAGLCQLTNDRLLRPAVPEACLRAAEKSRKALGNGTHNRALEVHLSILSVSVLKGADAGDRCPERVNADGRAAGRERQPCSSKPTIWHFKLIILCANCRHLANLL